jgi:HPt (histidine-containing phosphotransfer) domain-containing protein
MNLIPQSDPQASGLAEALTRLWSQFLPQMYERVDAIERAVGPLANGTISDTQREEADAAAHKLAGILGSFGIPEGTILAREAETLCNCGPEDAKAASARLTEIVALLRNEIESRK